MLIGNEHEAQRLSQELFREGFLVSAFAFPVVAKTKARIRFQVTAEHTEEDLGRLVEAMKRQAVKACNK